MQFPWKLFPEIKYVVSYGSSIFPQKMAKDAHQQLDFIFVVPFSGYNWHKWNLQQNASHYSFLKYGGAKLINRFQQCGRVPIYFNTLVTLENEVLCKYGVIEESAFVEDLKTWKSFFLSGRTHKPVLLIQPDQDATILATAWDLIESNRLNALKTALLLLPPSFTFKSLLLTICGLSYKGDVRRRLFEDKNKLENVVNGQILELFSIYFPLVTTIEGIDVCSSPFSPIDLDHAVSVGNTANLTLSEAIQRVENYQTSKRSHYKDVNPQLIQFLLSDGFYIKNIHAAEQRESIFNDLPETLRFRANRISANYRMKRLFSPFSLLNTKNFSSPLGKPLPYDEMCVSSALNWTVYHSSLQTSVKSFFTAGVAKSLIYAIRKYSLS